MISPTKQVFAFQALEHWNILVAAMFTIFRPPRNWAEKEWSNGTEFSSYSYFPEYWDKLARYT